MARVCDHNINSAVCLDVEVNPKMPQTESKTVPEGNSPFPNHHEFGSGEPTMAELYRLLKERFAGTNTHCWETFAGIMKRINQHLAGLLYQAQRLRLATEQRQT